MARPNELPTDDEEESKNTTPPQADASSNYNRVRNTPRGRRSSTNIYNGRIVRATDEDSEGAVGYVDGAYPEGTRCANRSAVEFRNQSPQDEVISRQQYRRSLSLSEVETIRERENIRVMPHSNSSIPVRPRGSDSVMRADTPEAAVRMNVAHDHFRYLENSDNLSQNDIVGSQVYLRFLREEIARYERIQMNCLDPVRSLQVEQRTSASIRAQIIETGSHLRRLADEFARSPQREEVRTRAESVMLERLTFRDFSDLLYGLFQEGGVTWERVIVLFFFCTDLAIRALKKKLNDLFHSLVDWSRRCLMERLGAIVEQAGGWPSVFNRSVTYMYRRILAVTCAVTVFIIAFYFRRSSQ